MKRIVFTILSLGVLVGLFALYHLNQETLASPLYLTSRVSIPMWAAFFLVAGTFLAIPLLFGAIRDLRNLPKAWSSRRRKKTERDIQQRYSLAMEAEQAGNREAALERFQELLNRDPDHFESLLAAGNLLRQAGRFPPAVELHKRAHRLREDDPRPFSFLAADYEAAGELPRAMAVLGKIISRNPRQSLEPYRRLRALCIRDESWEKAWEVQQRIQNLEREETALKKEKERFSLGIQYELALERKREDRFREADHLLRRILKEAPDFGPASLELGRLLAEGGKESEALKVWKKGFAETGIPAFLEAIQDHYLAAEEPTKAIDALQEIIRDGRHPLLGRLYLGRLFERLEMVDQALEEFTSLESEFPQSAKLLHHLARLLERRGKHEQAAARYARLLERVDAVPAEYRCRQCQTTFPRWQDRCPHCNLWGSLLFQLREDVSPEKLGMSPAPVYSAG